MIKLFLLLLLLLLLPLTVTANDPILSNKISLNLIQSRSGYPIALSVFGWSGIGMSDNGEPSHALIRLGTKIKNVNSIHVTNLNFVESNCKIEYAAGTTGIKKKDIFLIVYEKKAVTDFIVRIIMPCYKAKGLKQGSFRFKVTVESNKITYFKIFTYNMSWQ